jgi:two-component system sensor histidine kinase DegS
LNNVARYSAATSVKVQIDMGDSVIKIAVDDDGKGFDAENISEKRGMGLKVIRDRVEMLGGSIVIDSVIGQGTRVSLQLPTIELPPA